MEVCVDGPEKGLENPSQAEAARIRLGFMRILNVGFELLEETDVMELLGELGLWYPGAAFRIIQLIRDYPDDIWKPSLWSVIGHLASATESQIVIVGEYMISMKDTKAFMAAYPERGGFIGLYLVPERDGGIFYRKIELK